MSYCCNLNICRLLLHTAPRVYPHYKDECMLYVHELFLGFIILHCILVL